MLPLVKSEPARTTAPPVPNVPLPTARGHDLQSVSVGLSSCPARGNARTKGAESAGAAEGNRTLVIWLGTRSSTIELQPPRRREVYRAAVVLTSPADRSGVEACGRPRRCGRTVTASTAVHRARARRGRFSQDRARKRYVVGRHALCPVRADRSHARHPAVPAPRVHRGGVLPARARRDVRPGTRARAGGRHVHAGRRHVRARRGHG